MAVLLTPLALALLADAKVRAFQKQAFGHLRKAAIYVRLMGWTIFLYYVGVLGGSFALGHLGEMMAYPLSGEGFAIYLRTGAAILGYVMLNLVARELYFVTQPRRAPAPR